MLDSLSLFLASSDPMSHVLDHRWGEFSDWTGITKQVLFLLLAAGLCVTVFPLVARRVAGGRTGGRLANFFEVLLLFIRDEMVRPFLGKEGDRYLPVIWTFFFLILFCNLLGLIPGSATATGSISITAGLAVCAFAVYHFHGIRENGFVRYVGAILLVGPWYLWPMMVPIEIFGHIVRPCALAIRLFANMVGGHTMLAVIMSFAVITEVTLVSTGVAAVSIVACVALNFLELLVAVIQAFVFAFLTTVFLSLSVHPQH